MVTSIAIRAGLNGFKSLRLDDAQEDEFFNKSSVYELTQSLAVFLGTGSLTLRRPSLQMA